MLPCVAPHVRGHVDSVAELVDTVAELSRLKYQGDASGYPMTNIIIVYPINYIGVNAHLAFVSLIGSIPRITSGGKYALPPTVVDVKAVRFYIL